MCLTIPRRVVAVGDGTLRVAEGEHERDIAASPALAGIAPGDYVLVFANVAIERIDTDEAEDQLRFLAQLGDLPA